MRRPTGFIKDNSYVALDVDMWCPRCRGGDGVCVGGDALVGGGGEGGCLCKSRHIWASISMGGTNLKS